MSWPAGWADGSDGCTALYGPHSALSLPHTGVVLLGQLADEQRPSAPQPLWVARISPCRSLPSRRAGGWTRAGDSAVLEDKQAGRG